MDGATNVKVNEYYVIKTLSGLAYKLYNVVKIQMKENRVDSQGFVSLSYASIRMKLGNNNNVVRIVNELEQHPEIIQVVRGNTSNPNKFKVNEILL